MFNVSYSFKQNIIWNLNGENEKLKISRLLLFNFGNMKNKKAAK